MPLDLSALDPKEAITAIYIGYYDRAPDAEGLEFWLGRYNEFLDGASDGDAGRSLSGIAERFATAIETRDKYPFFDAPNVADAQNFLTNVYQNLFNRDPDTAGLNFWSTKLVTGQIPVGEIIIRIIQGAQDNGPGFNDRQTVLNKIEVGCDWVVSAANAGITTATNPMAQVVDGELFIIDGEAYESATTILDGVTDEAQSLTDALADVDAFINGYGNDAPEASNVAETVSEDGVLNDFVAATDPDGDALTYSIAPGNGPDNGTLVMNADGTYTYTPDANYVGSDSFTYTVTDPSGETDTATVSLTVTNTNDAPVASGVIATTNEDTGVTITPNFTDLDNAQGSPDTATISVGSNPSNGSVVVNANGTVTYTPNADFFGTDSFQYIVTDAAGASSIATATVTVNAVNDAPDAGPAAANATEGGAVISGSVTATDVDGPTLSFSLNDPAPAGLSFNPNGTFTFNPADPAYNSLDAGDTLVLTVNFTVTDGSATDGDVLTITVTGTNDAPVASAATATGSEDSAGITVTAITSDVDADDTATFSVSANPSNGTVTNNNNGTFTYVPNANFNGVDTFTYTVTDSAGATSSAVATVTVAAVNDAPVSADVVVSSLEDQVVTGQLAATDVDGDQLTFAQAPGGDLKGGSLSLNGNGSYTYTPAADFNGTATFNYTVSDGNGGSAIHSVTINIAPVADIFTVGVDNLNGGDGDDTFLGNGATLNASDKAVGGAGEDTVIINVDTGAGQNAQALAYAGFELDVETFRTTVDGDGSATFDMSSSEITGNTFHVFNSTADSIFNRVNMTPDGDGERGNGDDNNDGIGDDEFNVYLDNVTENADVTFTTRPAQVTGNGDEVNIVAHNRDSNGFIGDVNFFGTPGDVEGSATSAGIEVVDISTAGSPLNVNIEDLNVPGANTLEVHTDSTSNAGDLIIGDNQVNSGITINSGAGVESITGFDNQLDNSIRTITGTGGNTNGSGGVALWAGDSGVTGSFGEGADTILGGSSGDNLSGNGGNDAIAGAGGNDLLNGGDGRDTLLGNEGNDTINGDAGNDVMRGGAGNDIQFGGTGNDNIDTGSFDAGAGTEFVDAGADNDAVTTRGEFLVGRIASDDLDPNNTVDTTDDVDELSGGAGIDTLTVIGSNSAGEQDGLNDVQQFETINLNNGTFDFTIGQAAPTTTGQTVFETDHDARVAAGGADGSTTINGRLSTSVDVDASTLDEAITLLGGEGNDVLIGGRGDDTISGGSEIAAENNGGNDAMWGGEGDDTFLTTAENLDGGDVIEGDNGSDRIVIQSDGLRSSTSVANPVANAAVVDGEISGIERLEVEDLSDANEGDLTINFSNFDNIDNFALRHDTDVDVNTTDAVTPRLTIDGSEMDAGEDLTVNFATNAVGNSQLGTDTDIEVISGGGDDNFNMGAYLDSGDVIVGGSNDAVLLNADGTVASGGDTVMITEAFTGDFANVSEIECIVIMGPVTNGTTFTFGADAEAAFSGSTPRIKLDSSLNATSITINTTAFAGPVIIEDNDASNTFNLGAGDDTVITGEGDDIINGNGGNDVVVVSGNELDGNDVLNLGGNTPVVTNPDGSIASGGDTVVMDNSGGGVTATSNLDTNATVENYVIATDGDRVTGVDDDDDNNLTFTNGNVNTLTTINVDATNLTDPVDTFTVTLDATQDDADFAFHVEGSATSDTFEKRNDGVDNNIDFDGNDGNDNFILNGSDAGSTTEYNGGEGDDTLTISGGKIVDDGFTNMESVEVLTAETRDDGVFLGSLAGVTDGDTIPVTLVANTTYVITVSAASTGGGTLGDPFLNILDANGVVLAFNDDINAFGIPSNLDSQISFTPAVTGQFTLEVLNSVFGVQPEQGTFTLSVSPAVEIDAELCARLGIEADQAGIETIIGKNGDDDIVLDSQFDNDLTVQLGAGDDVFNAGASSSALTINETDSNIDGNDTIIGGNTDRDVMNLTATGGTADLTGTSGVETFNVLEGPTNEAGTTIIIDNSTFNGVADREIDIDASDLDEDAGGGAQQGVTIDGSGVTSSVNDLDVVGTTGADTVTTGNGDDTVSAGDGNDIVNSGGGNDALLLGNGADVANTGDGNDVVEAGEGNDTVDGGRGSDTIDGEAGDDLITGGIGQDQLTGGSGADDFRYTAVNESFALSRDTITDFVETVDCIVIESAAIFAAITEYNLANPGNPTATNIGLGVTGSGSTLGFNNAGVFISGQGNVGPGFAADFSDAVGAISQTAKDGIADFILELNTGVNGVSKLWIDVNDDGALNGQDIQILMPSVNVLTTQSVIKMIDTLPPTVSSIALGIAEVDQSSATIETADPSDPTPVATPLQGFMDGSDNDGTAVTYSFTGTPAFGTLTLDPNTGEYVYTPDAAAIEALDDGDVEQDVFTVTVTDDQGLTATTTLTVTVTGADDAPTLDATTAVSVDEQRLSGTQTDTNLVQFLSADDVDGGDTLSFGIQGGLPNGNANEVEEVTPFGTLVVNTVTGRAEFVKNAAAIETLDDSETEILNFVVTVSDGDDGVVTQPLTVTLNGADDDPTLAAPVNGTVSEVLDSNLVLTQNLSGTLQGDDVDTNDTLTYGITGGTVSGSTVSLAGAYGTLVVNTATGAYSYTPNNNIEALDDGEADTDNFTVTVTDGDDVVATQPLVIDLNGANDAPVAAADTGTTNEDTALSVAAAGVLANDTDVDVEPLTVAAVNGDTTAVSTTITLSSGAEVMVNADGSYTYDPNDSFEFLAVGKSATDTFTYTVTDGDLTDTETVTITITGVNDAPVAVDDTFKVTEDAPGKEVAPGVLGNDTDVDVGDVLTVTSNSNGANGGLVKVAADGSYTYDPNGKFEFLDDGETATDTFTYVVDDGNGGSDTGTVTVTVTGVNDAPIAVDDVFKVDEDVVLTVNAPGILGNDTDVDIEPLTVAKDNAPFTVNADGSFTYDQAGAFESLAKGETAKVTFDYTVTDGDLTDDGEVVIIINGVNDGPEFSVEKGDDVAQEVLEGDAPLTTNGSVTVFDPDVSDNVTIKVDSVSVDGNYLPNGAGNGSTPSATDLLAMMKVTSPVKADGVDGEVNWNWDSGKLPTNFDYLGNNETQTLSYTLTADDGNGGTDTQVVTIEINGTNDENSLTTTTATTLTVKEDSLTATSQTFTFTADDLDDNDNLTLSTEGVEILVNGVLYAGPSTLPTTAELLAALDVFNTSGGSGDTDIDDNGTPGNVSAVFNGAGQFKTEDFDFLGENDSATITYTIKVDDLQGATSTQQITITIDGQNDAPVYVVSSYTGDSTGGGDNSFEFTLTDVDDGAQLAVVTDPPFTGDDETVLGSVNNGTPTSRDFEDLSNGVFTTNLIGVDEFGATTTFDSDGNALAGGVFGVHIIGDDFGADDDTLSVDVSGPVTIVADLQDGDDTFNISGTNNPDVEFYLFGDDDANDFVFQDQNSFGANIFLGDIGTNDQIIFDIPAIASGTGKILSGDTIGTITANPTLGFFKATGTATATGTAAFTGTGFSFFQNLFVGDTGRATVKGTVTTPSVTTTTTLLLLATNTVTGTANSSAQLNVVTVGGNTQVLTFANTQVGVTANMILDNAGAGFASLTALKSAVTAANAATSAPAVAFGIVQDGAGNGVLHAIGIQNNGTASITAGELTGTVTIATLQGVTDLGLNDIAFV